MERANIYFSTLSKALFADDVAWYNQRGQHLAKALVLEVTEALDQLRVYPFLAKATTHQHRELPLKVFPYVIVLREEADGFLVKAVFHTSLNPSKKYRSP